MKTTCTIIALIPLALAALAGCEGYKGPSLSGSPETMSTQTLCYRYVTGDEALAPEVAERGVDCSEVIKSDPLLKDKTP